MNPYSYAGRLLNYKYPLIYSIKFQSAGIKLLSLNFTEIYNSFKSGILNFTVNCILYISVINELLSSPLPLPGLIY